MSSDYDAQLFELLEQANDWPPSEVEQQAAQACAGGPVSTADLLAALERRNRLDGFLESPAWEDLEGGIDGEDPAETGLQVGEKVGHFRLLELLGRGGMGQVFLAEQEEPARRVALKLVRSRTGSAIAVERFRAEQQALARLNHPHVAQFHEADVTADGQPYFAMEWVDGLPIDQFFAARPWVLEERLSVFLDVCAAVQHAHQRQIVHRDLKPSNILVREVDGRPIAKVIDFGIAEAMDQPTGGPTASGGVYGTPEYLSPESFDGDVDTRADVYSLGVLLYELIAGVRPYRRVGGVVAHLIEQIRQGASPPPSVALDSNSGLVAVQRRRWERRLRGDLDAVVMKAMHRDRDQRYDAVADLIRDLQRFLEHRPVLARTASLQHRFGLLLRRRRGAVAAATIALLSIAAGVVGITLGLVRARQEAEAARLSLEEAEELASFLTNLFEEADPGQAQGAEITARELLDQGVERLQTDLRNRPRSRARLTRAIGDVYAKLDYFEPAEELLGESLTLFAAEYGEDHPETARALHGLAVMKTKAGDPDAARQFFERALAIQATHPETPQAALTEYHLGVLAFRGDDLELAGTYFDRACPVLESLEDQKDFAARCLDARGGLHLEQGQVAPARELLLRSLALREEALGLDHPHVATSLQSLCTLERLNQQLDLAVSYCARSYEIRKRVLGEHHSQVPPSLQRLGVAQRLAGRWHEAEASFQELLTLTVAQGDVDPGQHAGRWLSLGWVAWLRGRYDEAATRYRRALEILDEVHELESGRGGNAQLGLGLVLWKQGELDVAEAQLLRVHQFFEERFGAESTSAAWTAWGLAGVLRDRREAGDLERAAELYRQALDIRREHYPAGHEYLELTEADYREFLTITSEVSG